MDETRRSAAVWRRRLPAAVVAAACLAGVIMAVTGASKPLPALQFLPVGHWVYNSTAQRAYHVDGGGAGVDAEASVPGDAGSQVVQGDTSGYVVGHGKITQFGKSSLSVERTSPGPADEVPIGVEAAGGPYLVYRNAGKVVRLGNPGATMSTGGPVGFPTVSKDGTLWLLRADGTGLICKLDHGADNITSCPVIVPKGHNGALTMVRDRPEFVDTTAATISTVNDTALGAPVPMGVPVSPDVRPANTDVSGKVALLDKKQHTMTMIDPVQSGAKPVTVHLPDGAYQGPISSGTAAAVVDTKSNTLMTFSADGTQLDAKPIPKPSNPNAGDKARLTRGEDAKVYVDDADGSHVLVVGDNGKVTDVPVVGPDDGKKPRPGKNPVPGRNPGQGKNPDQGKPNPSQPPPDRPRPPSNPPPDSGGPSPDRKPVRPPAPPPEHHGKPPQKPKPPAVPASRPGAPGSVSATASGSGLAVSWSAAADNGAPITHYVITVSSSAGSKSQTVSGGARSTTITGLTGGRQYTVSVAAENSAGNGPSASANPVSLVGAAAAPDVTAQASGLNDADVSWSAPDLNGGTLVGYQVTATGQGTKTVTGTSTSYEGLTPGAKVTFTVRAITQGPGGKLTGAPGTASVTVPKSNPMILADVGDDTNSSGCDENCHHINVVMSGFPPNTTITVYAMRMSGGHFDDSTVTTDANGGAIFDDMSVDNGNPSFYVEANGVQSNIVRNWN